jgi:hypothetical protein
MLNKKLINIMGVSDITFNIVIHLLNFYRYFSQKKFLTDKKDLEIRFKRAQGYKLDLINPKTINEKIQWLKLYDRTAFHTRCADKYEVRSFFKKEFGEIHLIDLVLHTTDWREIRAENMPDFPFIIKPNHGSGWYKIIHNKNEVDWKEMQTMARYWLSQNYYSFQREWQYKNIKPAIIVEKLLICKNGQIPTNYRVHCMHGKVELIALTVYLGGNTENYRNLKFDREWKYLNFDWAEKGADLTRLRYDGEFTKPECINKIIEIAENVSKYFKYVRVDFFEVDGNLYHGEITFHDGGGFERITPHAWDLKLGSLLDLDKSPVDYFESGKKIN